MAAYVHIFNLINDIRNSAAFPFYDIDMNLQTTFSRPQTFFHMDCRRPSSDVRRRFTV